MPFLNRGVKVALLIYIKLNNAKPVNVLEKREKSLFWGNWIGKKMRSSHKSTVYRYRVTGNCGISLIFPGE